MSEVSVNPQDQNTDPNQQYQPQEPQQTSQQPVDPPVQPQPLHLQETQTPQAAPIDPIFAQTAGDQQQAPITPAPVVMPAPFQPDIAAPSTVPVPVVPDAVVAAGLPQPAIAQPLPSADFYNTGAKPGNTLGILSLILAVIVSPVGFILGMVSIVKGFKKGNKTLGFMGVAALPLSFVCLIIGITTFSAISSRAQADISKVHSESTTIDGTKVTINVPDKFTTKDEKNGLTYYRYIPQSEKDKKSDKSAGQIGVAVTRLNGVTADQIKEIEIVYKDPSNAQYKATNDATKKTISDSLETELCKSTPTISEPKQINNKGALFGVSYPFTCKAGDKIVANGVYVINFIEGKSVESIMVGIDDVWSKNLTTWDKIANSLTIE